MQFYHHIVAEKSFLVLQELKRKYQFILIGGWAVFLYTHSLKSKDIDIIVDYNELGALRQDYPIIKNERLKKYEIKLEEIDVDIYIPHYSSIGLKLEAVKSNTIKREGFLLPVLEILFLLKLYVWQERRGTAKGKKDELDILSLAMLPEFNWRRYLYYLEEYNFIQYHENFVFLLKKTKNIPELGVNEYKMARFKKEITIFFRKTPKEER